MSVVERIVLEPNYQRIPLFSNFLVKGKVLDRAGNPISGIPIRFYDLNTNTLIGYDTSKIDGSVQFGYILGEKTKLKIVGRYEQYGKTLAESNIVEVESYSLTEDIPMPEISERKVEIPKISEIEEYKVSISREIENRSQKYDVVSVEHKETIVKQDVITRIGEVLTITNIVNPPKPPYEYGVLIVKFVDYGKTYNLLKIDDLKSKVESCIKEYETLGFLVEKCVVYCDDIKIEGIDVTQIGERELGDLYGNIQYKLRFEFTGYMITQSPIAITPLIVTLVKWIASAFVSFAITYLLGEWLRIKRIEVETKKEEITLEQQKQIIQSELEKIREETKQEIVKNINQQVNDILNSNLDEQTKKDLLNTIYSQTKELQKVINEQEIAKLKAENEALQEQLKLIKEKIGEKPSFEEIIGKYVGYAILVVVIMLALYFIVKMFVFKGGGE